MYIWNWLQTSLICKHDNVDCAGTFVRGILFARMATSLCCTTVSQVNRLSAKFCQNCTKHLLFLKNKNSVSRSKVYIKLFRLFKVMWHNSWQKKSFNLEFKTSLQTKRKMVSLQCLNSCNLLSYIPHHMRNVKKSCRWRRIGGCLSPPPPTPYSHTHTRSLFGFASTNLPSFRAILFQGLPILPTFSHKSLLLVAVVLKITLNTLRCFFSGLSVIS